MKPIHKWILGGLAVVGIVGFGIWHFRRMRRFGINSIDWDAKTATFSFGGKTLSLYPNPNKGQGGSNGASEPTTINLRSHGATLDVKYDGILAIFNYKAGSKSGKLVIDFAKKTVADKDNINSNSESGVKKQDSAPVTPSSGHSSLSTIAQGFNFGRPARPKTNA